MTADHFSGADQEDLAIAIGTHQRIGNSSEIGRILTPTLARDELLKVPLGSMATVRDVVFDDLRELSGVEKLPFDNIVAVGAGALGSAVVDISAREGVRYLSILDKDVLLPHNIARHRLGNSFIGKPKAVALQKALNMLIDETTIRTAFDCDFLNQSALTPEVVQVLNEADLVFDFSASVAVARAISSDDRDARSASVFFNPDASDVVILIEDKSRQKRLSHLEADYYRHILSVPELRDHLQTEDAHLARYGNGCRDVSAKISAAEVNKLASIGWESLRSNLLNENACGKIIRSDSEGNAKCYHLEVKSHKEQIIFESWSLGISEDVLKQLAFLRAKDLPNETGGVLLGMVDYAEKFVMIVAVTPAPENSVKQPFYFERGTSGLTENLEAVDTITAGQVRYVGEWHSHPPGVAARPSNTDEKIVRSTIRPFYRHRRTCVHDDCGRLRSIFLEARSALM